MSEKVWSVIVVGTLLALCLAGIALAQDQEDTPDPFWSPIPAQDEIAFYFGEYIPSGSACVGLPTGYIRLSGGGRTYWIPVVEGAYDDYHQESYE